MKTLKSNISEACKIQVDCLKNSVSDSCNKTDMKAKVSDSVRLHKAMQEKLKTESYSEQIEVSTLVPDIWSRIYCSEYFNVFEYLVRSKEIGVILAKPAPNKGKTVTTETFHL